MRRTQLALMLVMLIAWAVLIIVGLLRTAAIPGRFAAIEARLERLENPLALRPFTVGPMPESITAAPSDPPIIRATVEVPKEPGPR